MTPPRPAIPTLVAAGLLLAGCTIDTNPTAAPASPSVSASASASASPAPSSTLSAAKQQSVDQATHVILAYEQLLTDLLADPEPRLNNLNDLVAQPQLEIDLNQTRTLLGAGKTVIESAGPKAIASVYPVKINLKGDPPTVTLLVCVDSSAVSGIYQDKPFTGSRQEMQYRVVKTTYLPDPGWAVAEVLPPSGSKGSRPC
jgi:hypothetical protein